LKAGGSKMLSEKQLVFHSHNLDENSFTVQSIDRSSMTRLILNNLWTWEKFSSELRGYSWAGKTFQPFFRISEHYFMIK